MSKYINADELYKTIRAKMRSCDTDTDYNRGIQQGFDFALSIIRNQPSADVVEVIRCKDCKYYSTANGGGCERPNNWLMFAELDDYCSYAERRNSN